MDIVINIQPLIDFFHQPADIILTRILILYGWLPVALVFIFGGIQAWLFYIRNKWMATQNFILLAIDIPRGNIQSPKAVENLFTYFGGAHGTINLIEKYWEGKIQLTFSFEIVSIDGYTQFLIRTPDKFRNLVESSVYSQYPDAEITEVEDYTLGTPTRFPDDEYDIYGCEFILDKNQAYPIKVYKEFEHQMGEPETTFRDPMASLMDLTSSLRRGEQLWYQIIIRPIGFEWPEIGDVEVDKILGKKRKSTGINRIIDMILEWMSDLSEGVYKLWGDIEEKKKDEKEDVLKMMQLTPKQKRKVEGIHDKCNKLGFDTKLRFVYLAKKDVMNKPKVANGMVGFMKQFASMDLNNIKPDMKLTATSVHYFYKEKRLLYRQNNIMRNYKNRSIEAGRMPYILNIEELATIWHFPVEDVVKAPLIQKVPGRKSQPPMTLPSGEELVSEEIEPFFKEKIIEIETFKTRDKEESNNKKVTFTKSAAPDFDLKEDKKSPPPNLPFV